MTDLDDRLTEEEAARLWQRAAQLQTRALERTEAADRDQRGADDDDEQAGYALVHVREAAIEAGISPEYLDAALADMRAERAIRAERRGGGLARRFLSDPPDVITVSRLVSAPPRAVLAAMERVFARDAYQLSLTDRRGDPLDGGLLTF